MRPVIIVAAALGMLSFALPAHAAESSLEFSIDGGTTWMASPPTTLFDPTFRVVPGDSISRTLLFRSTRVEKTAVIVTFGDYAASDSLFSQALRLSAADDSGSGISNARPEALPACLPLVPIRIVAQNEPIAITLSIAVSTTLDGHDAQQSMSTSTLDIALTDPENVAALTGCAPDAAAIPVSGTTATPSPSPTPAASAQPEGSRDEQAAPGGDGLASTGFTGLESAVVASVTAIVAGLLLLLVRRRRAGE